MTGDPVGVAGVDPGAEAMLRWLRRLVTGLALVMGIGILAIAAVLWLRLGPGAPAPQSVPQSGPSPVPPAAGAIPALPEGLALPADVTPVAVTFAADWLIVVGAAGEVLLFDRDGRLRQRLMPE